MSDKLYSSFPLSRAIWFCRHVSSELIISNGNNVIEELIYGQRDTCLSQSYVRKLLRSIRGHTCDLDITLTEKLFRFFSLLNHAFFSKCRLRVSFNANQSLSDLTSILVTFLDSYLQDRLIFLISVVQETTHVLELVPRLSAVIINEGFQTSWVMSYTSWTSSNSQDWVGTEIVLRCFSDGDMYQASPDHFSLSLTFTSRLRVLLSHSLHLSISYMFIDTCTSVQDWFSFSTSPFASTTVLVPNIFGFPSRIWTSSFIWYNWNCWSWLLPVSLSASSSRCSSLFPSSLLSVIILLTSLSLLLNSFANPHLRCSFDVERSFSYLFVRLPSWIIFLRCFFFYFFYVYPVSSSVLAYTSRISVPILVWAFDVIFPTHIFSSLFLSTVLVSDILVILIVDCLVLNIGHFEIVYTIPVVWTDFRTFFVTILNDSHFNLLLLWSLLPRSSWSCEHLQFSLSISSQIIFELSSQLSIFRYVEWISISRVWYILSCLHVTSVHEHIFSLTLSFWYHDETLPPYPRRSPWHPLLDYARSDTHRDLLLSEWSHSDLSLHHYSQLDIIITTISAFISLPNALEL